MSASLIDARTSQGLEPWCTPMHTSRCHEQTKRVAPLSVSTTPPGQEPMPVVAVYQLLWKRCAYAIVKVRLVGVTDG